MNSLLYMNKLKEKYKFGLINNLVLNDYTQFPSSFKEAQQLLNNANESAIETPFTFATDIQIIDTTQTGSKYVKRNYEWVLGFYADYDIEFDLYVDNVLQNHYHVKKNEYSPLTKQTLEERYSSSTNEFYMHCSRNCPNDNDALEIRNLTTTNDEITNEIKLILLGVVLNYNESKETISSLIKEDILTIDVMN